MWKAAAAAIPPTATATVSPTLLFSLIVTGEGGSRSPQKAPQKAGKRGGWNEDLWARVGTQLCIFPLLTELDNARKIGLVKKYFNIYFALVAIFQPYPSRDIILKKQFFFKVILASLSFKTLLNFVNNQPGLEFLPQ